MVPMMGRNCGRPGAGSSSKMLVRPSSRMGSPAMRPMRMGCGLRVDVNVHSHDGIDVGPSGPAWQASSLRTGTRQSFPGLAGFTRAEQDLELGKNNSLLILVLALAVGVADFAGLISMEKQDLAKPFVGIDLGRQGRGI